MNVQKWLLAAAVSLVCCAAQAVQITQFSPQGEVARVRQVVAKFDVAMVRFGDPKAPAPVTFNCTDADATQGTGRWTSEREWVFDMARDLPPGVRCTATVAAGLTSVSGAALTGPQRYQFNTGGPFVQTLRPDVYERIDEEQFFVLQLNGPATVDSVQSNVWCVADGVGERIPVRMITGQPRADVLKALSLGAKACFVGRPWAYALGAGGEQMVAKMLGTLRSELATAMILTGCNEARNADKLLLDVAL